MRQIPTASLPAAAVEPSPPIVPHYCDRQDGAALVTRHFFKISARTLENWPVPTRRINGKAHYRTTELLAYARSVMEAAPEPRMSERRSKVAA
jgi:hypothetical protein